VRAIVGTQPMDIVFLCPQCDQSIAVDETAAGVELNCPRCGQELIVPSKSTPSTAKPPAEPKLRQALVEPSRPPPQQPSTAAAPSPPTAKPQASPAGPQSVGEAKQPEPGKPSVQLPSPQQTATGKPTGAAKPPDTTKPVVQPPSKPTEPPTKPQQAPVSPPQTAAKKSVPSATQPPAATAPPAAKPRKSSKAQFIGVIVVITALLLIGMGLIVYSLLQSGK
jgi:predicted RNA-binding Zn-ribbon protein involved in translation (DUF1610 family)